MSQKSSLPQPDKSDSLLLIPDIQRRTILLSQYGFDHRLNLRFFDGDAVRPGHPQHMREYFCHQFHRGRRVVVLIVSHGV